MAGALLPLLEGVNQHGRRTRYEQTHLGASLWVQIGQGQQAGVKSGHAHEHRGFRQIGQHPHRLKLGMPQHSGATSQGRMDGHKQTMHMEDGQGVQQHIVRSKAPVGVQTLGAAVQIGVTQHGALAASRGTTGVQNSRQIFRLTHNRRVLVAVVRGPRKQTATALVIQAQHVACAHLERQFANPAKVGRCAHHHRRLGVFHKISQLGALVSRI